jgi:hypothetical protein
MINEISRILAGFRPCFTRAAAFNWFVTVVFGFIVRIDPCGASSFVRWLGIKPALCTAMLAFFRASFWQLGDILQRWWRIVLDRCLLPQLGGRLLLAGDGIKICREADKMSAVKRLHQESDNSGKAPYIYGHHWGVIGILAGR